MSGLPAKKVRDALLNAYRKPSACVIDLNFYGDTVYPSSARVGFTRLAIHAFSLKFNSVTAAQRSACNAAALMV